MVNIKEFLSVSTDLDEFKQVLSLETQASL
jgi:hypothetical protein